MARRMRQQSLSGLTPSQSSVLATLDRHGPLNMGQLAGHEGISKPSATGIVGRLLGKGLVTREADPEDGRSVIVGITKEGAELLKARRRERTAYLVGRIASLDESDREVLERAVVLIENLMEEE